MSRVIVIVMVAVVASAAAAADPKQRPVLAVKKVLPGLDVVESSNRARHTHGGPPATIGSASVNLVVKDGKAHTVQVAKLELLNGHCRETTWSSRTVLKPVSYQVHDWDDTGALATGTTKVTLPAKSDLYSVSVSFVPVTAYQGCDRFAFAVRMLVDGKPVELEVPLEVMRIEPRRKP